MASKMTNSTLARLADVCREELQTTAGVRQIARTLLRFAETSSAAAPPNEFGDSLSQSCDRTISRLYHRFVTHDSSANLISDGAKALHTEFVHSVLRYGLVRVGNHLQRQRQRLGMQQGQGHVVHGPLIVWDILGDLMFHAIRMSDRLGLVTCRSHLGVLLATPGFLMMMEVFSRYASISVSSSSCGADTALRGPERVTLSLDVVFWALNTSRVMARSHPRESVPKRCGFVDAACLSYLGTILKLQRLMDGSLARTDTGTDTGMLRRGVQTLLANYSLFSVTDQGNETGTDADKIKDIGARSPAENMELRILQTIIAGTRLVNRATGLGVCSPQSVDFDATRWELASGGPSRWESRVTELRSQACAEQLGCWNPACVTLEGATESSMRVERCRVCRVVRYCSLACQQMDHMEHRRTCLRHSV